MIKISIPFFAVAFSLIQSIGCRQIEYSSFEIENTTVVNLDRSKDRMAAMEKQLTFYGISYHRFSAVDGSKFDLEQLELEGKLKQNDALKNIGRALTKGEIGNYFSHSQIFNNCVRELGKSTARAWMVLEDDVVLDDKFNDSLYGLSHKAPKDWDIIYLGCFANEGFSGFGTAESVDGYFYKLNMDCISGNYGYIINGKGASKVVKNMMPIRMPTDHFMAEMFSGKNGPFNAYCVSPEMIVQDERFGSLIHEMGRDH